MEKKYFEGFEGLKVPYLFFESERGEKFKNNIVIFHGNFYLQMDTMFLYLKLEDTEN